jgi:hypothetical protein
VADHEALAFTKKSSFKTTQPTGYYYYLAPLLATTQAQDFHFSAVLCWGGGGFFASVHVHIRTCFSFGFFGSLRATNCGTAQDQPRGGGGGKIRKNKEPHKKYSQ